MAGDQDLELNSVDRLSKRSSSMVLEEHGHCEVPAGCGGVVLRWFDPGDALPLTLWLYTPEESALWLDGGVPRSNRVMVPHGAHAFALQAVQPAPDQGVCVFAARFQDRPRVDPHAPSRSRDTGLEVSILSAGDGEWVGTTTPPEGDGWKYEGFDDSAWTPLVSLPMPTPGEKDRRRWRHRSVMDQGAQPIGLPGARGKVWLRRRFVLDLQSPASEALPR